MKFEGFEPKEGAKRTRRPSNHIIGIFSQNDSSWRDGIIIGLLLTESQVEEKNHFQVSEIRSAPKWSNVTC